MSHFLPASLEAKKCIAIEFLDVKDHGLATLDAYFKVYDSLIAQNDFLRATSVIPEHEKALKTHADILKVAQDLKEDSGRTRPQIRSRSFTLSIESPGILEDQNRAIDISARLMLMVDCSAYLESPGFEIDGFQPSRWRDDQSFLDFVRSSFPPDQPALRITANMLKKLKAWKLKRAHIKLIATDNLVEHLLYDPDDHSVRIFHHAAFLKAQLQRTSEKDLDCDMRECLSMGALPPRILLETLHSLQSVLFRLSDEKSIKLLNKLVRSKNFDKDCLQPKAYAKKDDFKYQYWGTRLAKLHDIVNDPQPRDPLHSWLRRHSNDKYALYVAIVSLVLSAFFSFLGVIIGIVQTWLAWKAWKSTSS